MRLLPSKAPRLLSAPVEYMQRFVDDLTNVLRLYFNQIDNIMSVSYTHLTLPTKRIV